MAVRSASDLVYTLIARLPFLLVIVGVAWVLLSGMGELERISFGTEWFVGNDETTNLPAGTGPTNEEILLEAYSSGDTAKMQAALDRVETRTQALATRP